ncbi:hypothetical protein HPB48_007604 [Haemaphysalis longicornis]|uniref:Uncharacterized protein n=1 Tax=Haemaphysalis longicornis TaxID=44386 RepID=A0A9J6FPZ7_HAELO|nr:hypothetical protein HPB48_007604 [Haemaphysalis longicornis]
MPSSYTSSAVPIFAIPIGVTAAAFRQTLPAGTRWESAGPLGGRAAGNVATLGAMELLFAYARSLRPLGGTGAAVSRLFPDLRRSFSLWRIEDLPASERTNPYILTGYRRCRSRTACLWSLLRWHNETVNVWSNIITLGMLAALLVEDNASRFTELRVDPARRLLLTVMPVAYGAMLLTSAIYHTFNCTPNARALYLLDFAGVWLSVVTYVLGFTALQFRGIARILHLSGAIAAAAPSFLLTAVPSYRESRYDSSRIRTMAWFALYSLVPLGHFAVSGDVGLVTRTLPGHVTVLVLLTLSLAVFISHVPERLWPGAVDLVGASHQIWHVGVSACVLIAHELQFAYVKPR